MSQYLIASACKNTGKRQTSVSDPHSCIQRVLAIDDSIGTVRNHACETISLAQTVQNYADGLARIDYSGCPSAFTQAFARHRQAWLDLIPLMEKYPDLRGEMHDLFNMLELGKDASTFKPLVKAVWDTWAEVEAASKL